MTTLSGDSPLPPLAVAFLEFRPGAHRLGELLVSAGACTDNDVSSALKRQMTTGQPIGQVLIAMGICDAAQIQEALEAQKLAASPLWTALGRLSWHPDLRRSHRTEGGTTYVVAGLPERGDYLRFDPTEFAIAELIARHGTYADILQEAWRSAGILVPPAQVAQLGMRLWAAGLLLDPQGEAPMPPRRRGLDWLVIRIPLWDPNPLLSSLGPVLRMTTTAGWFWGAWAPVVGLALGVTAWRWPTIWHEVETLAQQYNSLHHIGWIYLLFFLTLAVHEFGHAAVCSALGGTVRQIGIMVYMGLLFGYCDTSEAYRLGKRARMAVSMGGLYYQLGLAAWCLLAWQWLPMPPILRMAALDMAIISVAVAAFNLIPFARLDGYYLVSDWLDMPNLQARSLSYIGAKFLGKPGEPVSRKESAILSLYGIMGLVTMAVIAATAFRFWSNHLHR